MKKNLFLSGAAAAFVLGALDASAQFNYQNGDMLAAFGNGGATDVIVDLGAISNFQQPNASADVTFDLSAVLTSVFGSVDSSIYWSVFGVNDQSIGYNGSVQQGDPNTIWTTLARANPANQTRAPFQGSSDSYALAVGDIESIGNVTSPSDAGSGLIVDYAPGIEEVSTSVGNYSASMTGGGNNGNFAGDWIYNILNHGVGVSDLYQNDPSAPVAGYLGNFSLNSGGDLTFNPVPEPSTWAMAGSGALALLALRRRK